MTPTTAALALVALIPAVGILGLADAIDWPGIRADIRTWTRPNRLRPWWYRAKHRDGYSVAVTLRSIRAQADALLERTAEHRIQWLEVAT